MNKNTASLSIVAGGLCRTLLVVLSVAVSGCGPSRTSSPVEKAACPGYTLVQQLMSRVTSLIDSDGNAVHRWISDYRFGGGTYLLENGNLLRSAIPNLAGLDNATPGLSGMVELLDWDGNQLWSYTLAEPACYLHHDIEPMPNGNIMMLVVEHLSPEEQISLGRDPTRATMNLKLDYLIEVKPEGMKGGAVVWEWHMKDHLIQDFDKTKRNYGVVADHPEKLDINFIESLFAANSASSLRLMQSLGYVSSTAKITPQRRAPDWTHANAVAYHPVQDQLLLSIRSLGEIWIIDHSVTTQEAASNKGGKQKEGGGIIYRWGNPQAHQRGSPSDQVLFGQHDAQWIPPGCPGEGNIIIFNNGEGRREGEFSSIEEIRPPMNGDGGYNEAKGEVFGPAKPIWRYEAEKKEDFYSSFIAGVQRLPNGNTLICSGVQGRMFEVTKEGELAWEHKMEINVRSPGKAPGESGRMGPGGRPVSGMMRPGGRGGASPVGDTSEKNENGFTAAEMAVLTGNPLPEPGGGAFAPEDPPRLRRRQGPSGAAARGLGGGGLFRATRFPLDYPAFIGRKLEPLPPLPARPMWPGEAKAEEPRGFANPIQPANPSPN